MIISMMTLRGRAYVDPRPRTEPTAGWHGRAERLPCATRPGVGFILFATILPILEAGHVL